MVSCIPLSGGEGRGRFIQYSLQQCRWVLQGAACGSIGSLGDSVAAIGVWMGSSFKGKSRVTLSAMSQLIFPHQGLNFGSGGFNAAHETEFVLHQGMVNDDHLVGQACTPG